MSGGGSDSKVRSKISRGSSDNETEWITDMDSGGVNEDWCRNEGPRPSTLALRGLKGFATQLDSRHHVAERVLTLPVPHALNLLSTTPRRQFFLPQDGGITVTRQHHYRGPNEALPRGSSVKRRDVSLSMTSATATDECRERGFKPMASRGSRYLFP